MGWFGHEHVDQRAARQAFRPNIACGFESLLGPGNTISSFGSLAPLWCCQAYPACFSTFSCFVGQRSCQNFGLEIEQVLTVGTFPLVAHVLKLEWDKAASYPACQV